MTNPSSDASTEESDTGGHPSPEEMARAMATYSGDGQVDDETGGDGAAELMRTRQEERGERPPVPHEGPH